MKRFLIGLCMLDEWTSGSTIIPCRQIAYKESEGCGTQAARQWTERGHSKEACR